MTILRTHHHDGTVGASATAAGEGYDALTGTAPIYVTGGYRNQALRWTSGAAAAYLADNLTAGYFGCYLRLPTARPLSDLGLILLQNSAGAAVGSLVVSSSGQLVLYTGQASVVATSTTALTTGAWYRLEYHCDADGQTLKIFTDPASATAAETLTGATTGSATAKMHVGNPWTGKPGTTGDTVDIDEFVDADAWPNLGNTAPTANAGTDQAGIAAGATVTLDGTGSSDPDVGDTITYAWTQTAGDTVTLSSATAAQPTFTAPSTSSPQTLTFSLTVTDSHGTASTPDTVNVGVLAAPATSNLKIRIGGVAVPAVKLVRINGAAVAVTESISAGAVGDASLFSDTFSDTF